ncbi:MAG TPA: hypothetical protein VHO70_01845 [Chitinispirillaceae bacterium]|nr:hypothetical protein [Chitinispirillaceae bacterium]
MKIKSSQIFTWFFLTVITSVAVIQVILELYKKEPVQFLSIFSDTFISPYVSISKNNGTFKTAFAKLDTISTILVYDTLNTPHDEETVLSHIEEVQALLEDVGRSQVNINRYYSDSSALKNPLIDSIVSCLQNIQVSLRDNGNIDSSRINQIRALMLETQKEIVPPGTSRLLLPVKHFFRYTAFNKKYLRSYEKDLEKSSVIANTVRPMVQYTRFTLLKDYGDKAIAGKNGWLFYKPDVEYLYRPSIDDPRSVVVDYNDKPLSDDPLAIITDFKNQLHSMGIELLVVIVPGKPSIYPDLLGTVPESENYRSFSRSLKFIENLRKNGVETVDLFHPFLEERKRDQQLGDSLYLKKDTHWRPRGASLAAKIVSDDVQKRDWFAINKKSVEYILDTVEVTREGDIGVMTRLSDFKLGKLQVTFSPEKTKCVQVNEISRDDSGNVISKTLYKDDYRTSRILLLGDSFSRIYQTDEPRGAGWIAHLAYNLGEPVASIVNDGGASTIVRQVLSRKKTLLKRKKLVIWEFVERDLRFGDMGWQKIDFTADIKE